MIKTILNPKFIAKKIDRTDPNTDEAPLTPHIQGVKSWDLLSTVLIPIGKGLPIKKARGDNKTIAVKIL